MRVIVTGGAGFIGANTCRRLSTCTEIDEVVAVDDLSTGQQTNLDNTDASLVIGSILDAPLLMEVFSRADAVIHLAARPSVPRSIADPWASHLANTSGTAQVLEACRVQGVRHIVVASSSSVYGDTQILPKTESMAPRPRSPYAATKLATEAYAIGWGHAFDLEVLVFRFFNVFGPLQSAGHAYAAVIPAFVSAALRGAPVPIFGDGTQTRDFTYVDSVASVLVDAILRRVSNPAPINLAFGTRHSLLELVDLLSDILDRSLDIEYRAPRPGDVRDSQADQRVLRELFPKVDAVPLRTGLERTIEWFRNENQTSGAP